MLTCIKDACAADIYYHNSCSNELHIDARDVKNKVLKAENSSVQKSSYDTLVFSQLIAYIQYGAREEPHILADLKSKYLQKLEHTNSELKDQVVNSTR